MVREKDGQRKQRRDGGRAGFGDVDDFMERNRTSRNSEVPDQAPTSDEDELEVSPREKVEAPKEPEETEEEKTLRLKREAADAALDDELEQEMKAKFNVGSAKKNRKQQEESSSEDEEDAEQRKKEDMERLREARERREQQKLEREKKEREATEKAEREKAEADAKAKEDKVKYDELRAALEKLLAGGKELSINQLNQDAACKKLLKPLLKKAAVKTLNKQALEKICDKKFKIEEREAIVYVKLKA